MDEISNRSLAVLLVVAIVVSIGGTFMSLSKLNQAPTAIYIDSGSPTGYATNPSGNTTVTITTSSELTFTVGTIAFGSGFTNTSALNYCNITSRTADPTTQHYEYCTNFNDINTPLVLENTGNTNFSIHLLSNTSAADFIGGGMGGGPLFQYRLEPQSTDTGRGGSDDDGAASCEGGWRDQESYVDVNTSTTGSQGTLICGSGSDWPFSGANVEGDEVHIDVYLRIPFNAPPGARKAVFTATGTAPS